MNHSKQIFHQMLREYILTYRFSHSLSQESMAEELHISPRAYFDQEHGRYGFSSRSFSYFLLLLSDDEVLSFLNMLRTLLNETEPVPEKTAPPVQTPEKRKAPHKTGLQTVEAMGLEPMTSRV